jgi:glycerophosphoryl diester phosphodiesterase
MADVLLEDRLDRMETIEPRLAPIIAHRGASAAAPENTLAAIRLAAVEGATWVEVDVKLSRDGVCILMHDDLLRRTTNGRGEVAHYDLDELKALDAGSWFSRRFAGERIPTLVETLELALDLDLDLNLEIKPCPGRQHETAIKVVETLQQHWPKARPWPLLSSFAVASLEEVRLHAPEMPRGLLIGRPTRRGRGMLDRLDCVTLHCDARRVSKELVRSLAATGRPVLCYTVNDPNRARRLLEMGVTSIITDRPGDLRAALAEGQPPAQ